MPTILIVDDELDLLDLLNFHLLAGGYDVVTAMNGREALIEARSALPDLIIVDLMMPELDGIAVTEILRRFSSTRSTPIIMLTACGKDGTRAKAIKAGVTEYLNKPLSPHDVLRRIRMLLQTPVEFGIAEFPEGIIPGRHPHGQ